MTSRMAPREHPVDWFPILTTSAFFLVAVVILFGV